VRVETHLPAYEDGRVCPETSAYKIQTPGNHPKKAYNVDGIRLPGLFEREEDSISGFLSWTQRTLRF